MSSARQKGKLHILEPRVYQYTYGPNQPVLRVGSGDSVTASTIDAHGFDHCGNPLTIPYMVFILL